MNSLLDALASVVLSHFLLVLCSCFMLPLLPIQLYSARAADSLGGGVLQENRVNVLPLHFYAELLFLGLAIRGASLEQEWGKILSWQLL